MRILSILLIAAYAVNGCAADTQTTISDDRPGVSLDCSGTGKSWSTCFSAASEACGSAGYDVVDRVDVLSNYDHERSIVVTCKE